MPSSTEYSHRIDSLHVEGALNVNGGFGMGGVRVSGDGLYSVRDFGATGDGTTDDTAAILSTIRQSRVAGVGYNTIYFPPGTYKFSEPLVFPNGSNVLGCVHAGVPSRLRYYGADATNAVTLGAAGLDWSAGQFAFLRLDSGTVRTSGRGLTILNPTNGAHVHDILVTGFPSGAILVDDATGGAGNPGPNFFRLSNFFAVGGTVPLEVQGGRQNIAVEFGGIDIDATSTAGFKWTGGEGQAAMMTMTSVKVEGAFDVPGFQHSGSGGLVCIGCARYSTSQLTTAGPAFLCDEGSNARLSLINCSSLGCVVGFKQPNTPALIQANPAGGFLPLVLPGGSSDANGVAVNSLLMPFSSNYNILALHAGLKLAWTTSVGDPSITDTNLYRSAANVLKTDDTLHAALGVATMTKAGTPSDADWAVAPPVGTMVVDTTANKIWARTGVATWKGVVIA